MKEFIEALKKHGYKIECSTNSGGIYAIQVKVGSEYSPDKWIEHEMDEETPVLAFWCLDEIERLGWYWGFESPMSVMPTYRLIVNRNVRHDESDGIGSDAKTKTGACMNALVAVLEAQVSTGTPTRAVAGSPRSDPSDVA